MQQTHRCSFFLASARTKQLETSPNAQKIIAVVVCQRHSRTHTRADFASKHHRSSLLEAPLAWCAVRSHNSDPTSSGQTVATVNRSCGELFSLDRAAPPSVRARPVRIRATTRRPHLGPRPAGWLLDQAATSAAFKNHLPRGTQLESRGTQRQTTRRIDSLGGRKPLTTGAGRCVPRDSSCVPRGR